MLLLLKSIAAVEVFIAGSLLASAYYSFGFLTPFLGFSITGLAFLVLGIRSIYFAHEDYRTFLLYKGEEQHTNHEGGRYD